MSANKTVLRMFIVTIAAGIGITQATCSAEESGESLFKKYCAVCHVDGGNIVNPNKTFHKKDLDANNVKTEEDIIKIMRNPGPGMTKFNEKTIPDAKARKIAVYILSTF